MPILGLESKSEEYPQSKKQCFKFASSFNLFFSKTLLSLKNVTMTTMVSDRRQGAPELLPKLPPDASNNLDHCLLYILFRCHCLKWREKAIVRLSKKNKKPLWSTAEFWRSDLHGFRSAEDVTAVVLMILRVYPSKTRFILRKWQDKIVASHFKH